MDRWPDREERELQEIEGVIRALKRIYPACSFGIFDRTEQPDFLLIENNSCVKIGMELTSVYLSDRSVPDRHKPEDKMVGIPYLTNNIDTLYKRMINKIEEKITKAKNWPKRFDLLMLAVLLNEYETIYLEEHDWEIWIAREDIFFNNIGSSGSCVH